MLKRLFIGLFIFVLANCFYLKAIAGNNSEISNWYYSFTMPKETQGTYVVEKSDKTTINISEKISQKTGKGGFAFGFRLYKNPGDYAGFDIYKKIGELTDKKGTLYDMVLIRPADVSYGEGETIEKNYNQLFELAENLEIKGVNGSKYFKNRGMKGEDLYGNVLKKHVNMIKENWDYSQYMKSHMSPKYLFFPNKKQLDKIGYIYYDINNDGIDELIIGEITKGKKKGNIYNLYTMVNRKPMHVFGADADEQYFVCNSQMLCEETVVSKDKRVFTSNSLAPNTNRLTNFEEYLFDRTKDKQNPWFKLERFPNRFEKISKEDYKKGIKSYNNYERFDFIPLRTVNY